MTPRYDVGQHIWLDGIEYIVVSQQSKHTYTIQLAAMADQPKYWWADCFPQWKGDK